MLTRDQLLKYSVEYPRLQRRSFHKCRKGYMNAEVCYSSSCENLKCRNVYLNSQHARLVKGMEKMEIRGDNIWFFTITLSDKDRITDNNDAIVGFKERSGKLLKRLNEWARRAGKTFLRIRVFGLKGMSANSPRQIHAHVIVSWVPDPKKIKKSQFNSLRLSEYAQKLGLKIHLEKVREKAAVARYMMKNLKELIGIALPRGFQKITYNRAWPQLDFWYRKKERLKKKVTDNFNSELNEEIVSVIDDDHYYYIYVSLTHRLLFTSPIISQMWLFIILIWGIFHNLWKKNHY